jgi:DNA repair exonuclease SbcCD ATPase subunit
MKHAVLVFSAFASVAAASAVSAQSLADVARREEERRKAKPSSGKVYTNDSLRTEPSPGAPPAQPAVAPAPAPSRSGVQDDAKEPAAEDSKKDEKSWRERIQAERDALQRAQIFAEALQTRINSLSNDFTSRDDPAQRSAIATDRQKALAELDRVKQEIQQHTKAIAGIQEEARRAGVPAGWVR